MHSQCCQTGPLCRSTEGCTDKPENACTFNCNIQYGLGLGREKKNVSHRHCLDKHSHLPRSPFHPMTPFAFTLSSWPAQHPFPVCCFALMKSPCKCMGDSFQASTTCTSRASQLAAQLQLVEACLSQLCIGEVVLIGAELWQQSSV